MTDISPRGSLGKAKDLIFDTIFNINSLCSFGKKERNLL